MEFAPSRMALIDLDRRFLEVNPALCRMLDRDEEWLLARRVADIMHPEDDAVDLRMRAEVLSGMQSSITREKRLRRADGTTIWVEHGIGLLRDDDEVPRGYVSQFVNITEARRAREELRFLATHDPLTRLVNRPELLSQMEQVLGHAPRTGRSMATLFIDLDGLKSINDTYGHSAGDAVIVGVAERLRSNVRRGDLVARLGGDEFVVVLPAIHSVDDAERIAQKTQDAMIDPIAAESGARADDVLEFADRALYRAKRSGRAKTVTFDPRMDAASQDRD